MIAAAAFAAPRARAAATTSRSTPTRAARWRASRRVSGEPARLVVYPQRVMTRRRRLRTRTLVLSLAATLAGIVALPVQGAPDPLQQALRSWDVVIGDGRSGQALPQQVIIVLAAPPAVSVEGADASKTAAATQQLDLDALDARRHLDVHPVPLRQRAQRRLGDGARPTRSRSCAPRPRSPASIPCARLYPAATVARHLAALGRRRAPARGRAAATARA